MQDLKELNEVITAIKEEIRQGADALTTSRSVYEFKKTFLDNKQGRIGLLMKEMRNVPNDQKATLQEKPEIKADIEAAAAELGDNGRILVRPSGTEALVRVMVEGKDSAQVDTLAKRVAKTIESVV